MRLDRKLLSLTDRTTVSDILPGTTFTRGSADSSVYVKLKPVSFLLKSNTVKYSVERGKALVADIETGAAFFIPGDEPITVVEAVVSLVK